VLQLLRVKTAAANTAAALYLISFETVGCFLNILYKFDLVEHDLAKPGMTPGLAKSCSTKSKLYKIHFFVVIF